MKFLAGSIDVRIRAPNGLVEKADVRFNNDDKLSYSVSYLPKIAGDYKVFVTFLGKDIPNSPFNVNVAENGGDVSKIELVGPGLQPESNFCGKSTYFEIIAEGLFLNLIIIHAVHSISLSIFSKSQTLKVGSQK